MEIYKIKLAELDKKSNANANLIKDIERTLKSLQEQRINDTGEQQKANVNLGNIKKTLSAYFSSEQWFQDWQTDPDNFAKRIKEFTHQWKSNIQQQEENVRQQGVWTATLKGIQEQSNNLHEEVKQKDKKLSQVEL